jgi:hypothetical protein
MRLLDEKAPSLIYFYLFSPRSLEEVKGIEVLSSSSVDGNNQVGESAGAVHHSHAGLLVCSGHVGIRKSLTWSHAYIVVQLGKCSVFSRLIRN